MTSARPLQAEDVTRAAWIGPRLAAFASGVNGVIPNGFEAYARILHPALSDGDQLTRWSEVAATTGTVDHALMQFHSLVGVSPFDSQVTSGAWTGSTPEQGNLEPESLAALLAVLAQHTPAGEQCWFCLWEGYGMPFGTERSTGPGAPRIDFEARVELPQRNYVLFGGPLESAPEIGHWATPDWFLPHSPNIFWPDDRSWCVASEIDLYCTYVGGSRAVIDELLVDERLEVWEANLDDPVVHDSDELNG
ncbi:MAG TPA: hypothetical protein VGD55_11105 [Acidothermaceae bacterium]